jgi:DUF971 family protein
MNARPVDQPTTPDPRGDAVPKDLKVQLKEQRLTILWGEGRTSEYPLGKLRALCPCATCRGEREKASANPLAILKTDPTTLRVTTARLIGNYAIQFDWSDGHNAGMFDYRFLRGLSD